LQYLRDMVATAEADVANAKVGVFDRNDIKRDVRRRLADRGINE
jgi:hypothetical protein